MYADDTGENSTYVIKNLQDVLNTIITWCKQNILTINESKTTYCLFNHKGSTDLICKDRPLGLVLTHKYLGADITSDLSMAEYVTNVYKKASYKIHMLSRIRKFITTRAAIQIYKQIILPHLDYASFLFLWIVHTNNLYLY